MVDIQKIKIIKNMIIKKYKIHLLIPILLVLFACSRENDNKIWRVQYVVDGTAKTAFATIAIPNGGTEQGPVVIPRTSTIYYFETGDVAYISAQNQGGYGNVIVKIVVNGVEMRKATAHGGYAIASVSWVAGTGFE